MRPGATSSNANMIRDGHPACRLKPASPAVPAASAKEENKNNNDEKCLGIHDVQPFQCNGSGLGLYLLRPDAHYLGRCHRPCQPSQRCGTLFLFARPYETQRTLADLIEQAGREEAESSRIRRMAR